MILTLGKMLFFVIIECRLIECVLIDEYGAF
jgi:hypothetical protein